MMAGLDGPSTSTVVPLDGEKERKNRHHGWGGDRSHPTYPEQNRTEQTEGRMEKPPNHPPRHTTMMKKNRQKKEKEKTWTHQEKGERGRGTTTPNGIHILHPRGTIQSMPMKTNRNRKGGKGHEEGRPSIGKERRSHPPTYEKRSVLLRTPALADPEPSEKQGPDQINMTWHPPRDGKTDRTTRMRHAPSIDQNTPGENRRHVTKRNRAPSMPYIGTGRGTRPHTRRENALKVHKRPSRSLARR